MVSTRDSFALRVGGGAVLLGGAAWLLLGRLHGELPVSGQEAVEHLRGTFWQADHIFTIISIAVVAAGLALLSGTLGDPLAEAVGHFGAMIAVPAGAVLGVGFAVDGFVLSALAEAYAAAPGEAMREMHVAQADLVLKFIGGTSYAFQTLFGLGLTMLAAATLLSRLFPRWLCLLGIAGGAIWTIAAVLVFLRVQGADFWLVDIPVIPVAFWLLGFGWLSWKRSTAAA